MIKNSALLSIVALAFFVGPLAPPSCEDIVNTAVEIAGSSEGTPAALSDADVIEGLKTALNVGTDSSVSVTSRLNGFYKDEAIKILLPPEADIIYENKDNALVKALGFDKKLEDAIMSLNRAAEDAAKEAGPIFKEAILSMSISDGWSILRGNNPAVSSQSSAFDSTAATGYLSATTMDQLRMAFAPKVNASLDKKLMGNFSPNQIWGTLSTNYNNVASKSFGMVKPMETTDLGSYVTEKALEGLFLKVAEEEIKIRRDPWAWAKTSVGNILGRVFGKKS